MLQADILKIVMGASSFLGVIGLLSYLYFTLQFRQAERSVQNVIGGDSLFNAAQVLSIMAQFKDDASRLEALKELTKYDTGKARSLLTKVKGNIDVMRLSETTSKRNKWLSLAAAVFFCILAALAFAYSNIAPVNLLSRDKQDDSRSQNIPTPSPETVSATWSPQPTKTGGVPGPECKCVEITQEPRRVDFPPGTEQYPQGAVAVLTNRCSGNVVINIQSDRDPTLFPPPAWMTFRGRAFASATLRPNDQLRVDVSDKINYPYWVDACR
jgi:hypothetical protein